MKTCKASAPTNQASVRCLECTSRASRLTLAEKPRIPYMRALTRHVNTQLRQLHRNAVHHVPSGVFESIRAHAKTMKHNAAHMATVQNVSMRVIRFNYFSIHRCYHLLGAMEPETHQKDIMLRPTYSSRMTLHLSKNKNEMLRMQI